MKNPIPILSFNKYVLRTYYVLSSFRHLGYTANKSHKDPCCHGASIPVMGDELSI